MRFTFELLVVLSLFGAVLGFDLVGELSKSTTAWRFTNKGLKFTAKNLTVTEAQDAVTSVNGENRILADVLILSIRNETLHFLPADIDKFFPNLEAIEIFNSSLRRLDQDDMMPFTELRELWCSQNKLEKLANYTFRFNPELRLVVFSKNQLSIIGKYLFAPLPKIEIANFNNNKCIDKYIGFPHQMHELFVALQSNCQPIEVPIQPINLQALTQKKEDAEPVELDKAKTEIREYREKLRQTKVKLNLTDGHLDAAVKNLFVASKALESRGSSGDEFMTPPTESQYIDLACYTDEEDTCDADDLRVRFNNMKIHEVVGAGGQTITLNKIKKLSIVEQQTLFLPSNLAEHFEELTELKVTLSGLFTVKWDVFHDLKKLEILDLSHNKVHEIPPNAFEDLESLIELDLSYNNLETIDDAGFKGLKELKELKLNNNDVSELSSKSFEKLEKLERLLLHKNFIRIIDGVLLTPLKNLKVADLSNNDCIDISFPKKNIRAVEKVIREKCVRH